MSSHYAVRAQPATNLACLVFRLLTIVSASAGADILSYMDALPRCFSLDTMSRCLRFSITAYRTHAFRQQPYNALLAVGQVERLLKPKCPTPRNKLFEAGDYPCPCTAGTPDRDLRPSVSQLNCE